MQHLTKNKFYCFLILVLVIISCNKFIYLEGLRYEIFDGTAFEEMAEAADDGDCERLRELMATGKYDINQVDSVWGSSLLQIAVAHHEMDIIKCLLDLGADPNAASFNNGSSASSVAVQDFGNVCDTAVLALLLQYGMDVNFVERCHINWDPKQPIGPQYSLLRLSASGCIDITEFLVNHGADINSSDDRVQATALNESIILDNFEIAEYLLISKKALYTVCLQQGSLSIAESDSNCVSTLDYLKDADCNNIFIDCNKVEKLKKYILDHPEQARYVEVPKGK